jgi:hypothetical protein
MKNSHLWKSKPGRKTEIDIHMYMYTGRGRTDSVKIPQHCPRNRTMELKAWEKKRN